MTADKGSAMNIPCGEWEFSRKPVFTDFERCVAIISDPLQAGFNRSWMTIRTREKMVQGAFDKAFRCFTATLLQRWQRLTIVPGRAVTFESHR